MTRHSCYDYLVAMGRQVNKMAAQKKINEKVLLLPPLANCRRNKVRKTSVKRFGNFGAYLLLPAVDPVQNVNAFYGVKRVCKLVCEWYLSWRPWQKEVLLCSLSGKCSRSQLSSLSTILEPVFHRDFMLRLQGGKYPVRDLKEKTIHAINIENMECKNCEVGRNAQPQGSATNAESKQTQETEDSRVLWEENSSIHTIDESSNNKTITLTLGNEEPPIVPAMYFFDSNTIANNTEYSIRLGYEPIIPSTDSGVKEEATDGDYVEDKRASQHGASLTDLVSDSIGENYQKEHSQDRRCKSEEIRRVSNDNLSEHSRVTKSLPSSYSLHQVRSRHVHTSNSYRQHTDKRFFPASHSGMLSDMKASLPSRGKYKVGWQLSDLDQTCYKHKKWWPKEKKKKELVAANGVKLWNHFTRQLKEINETMDEWGGHEQVNLLSEVIKSSDPEQIDFFAQCLIQRLKDHTDVSILPDQTILKIFSKLDAKTLCQVSQVSRRWRYLGEDANVWRHKCLQLGLSKGIKNLIFLIEQSASSSQCIDWKQAYREVCKIFKNTQAVKNEEDQEGSDYATMYKRTDHWHQRKRREYLAAKILKARAESGEAPQQQDARTPKPDGDEQVLAAVAPDIQLKRSKESASNSQSTPSPAGMVKAPEDMECRDDDLTGGNLGMLEESLLELTEGDHAENNDELALDIRPNKIQANNEMDTNGKCKCKYITLGVEDVKSVKRVRKLQGHMEGVFAVQFDAKRCLTGSADCVLRMWDIRSGRGIRTMLGHMGGVRCVQFDNEKILSGSWDTTIMVWDIVKFTRLRVLHGHEDCVSCLRFNSRHIVSGSHDTTVRVWDVNTWQCLDVLTGHTDEVTCLFLAGVFLLTGSADRTIKLWNIENGHCLKTLTGHKSAVLSVQASRALVISGSEEGKIMFSDIESGAAVMMIQAHDGPCHCLFIWRNHFLSGGGDHLVKQWDISTQTCLRTLQGHKGPVQCVRMSSRRIVSSSEDGTVRIWDLEVPVQKIGRQFDEIENTLLPFEILEHSDEEENPDDNSD